MGKTKHSGGGAGTSRGVRSITNTFKRKKTKRKTRKYPIGDQQGASDEEPDEEIPRRKQRALVIGDQRGDSDEEEEDLREADRRYHELAALRPGQRKKGVSAVKRNKRSGRNTRRKSRLLRVYGNKKSKTKTK
jgi:hypothetical protein